MEKTIKLYGGKVKLIFKEKAIRDNKIHWFEHPDGTKIPGVTSITGQVDKSGPLMGWAVKMAGEYIKTQWTPFGEVLKQIKFKPKVEIDGLEKVEGLWVVNEELIDKAKREYRQVKIEAANIGKEVHKLCEQWIKGERIKMPEDRRVKNGFIAFQKWIMDREGIKINTSESPIYSKKYEYAGIMDWDGEDNGELVMGDFKTSSGIHNEMRYQLAAYWQAREEELGIKYKKGYIVQFGKEDGEFHVLEIPRSDYKKDLQAFLGLIKLKKRENELK